MFLLFSASVNNKAHYPRCSRPALRISVWIHTSSFVSGPSSPRQRQPPPQQLHLKNQCLCAATAFAFNYVPFFRKSKHLCKHEMIHVTWSRRNKTHRNTQSGLGWRTIQGVPCLSPQDSFDRLQNTPATRMRISRYGK